MAAGEESRTGESSEEGILRWRGKEKAAAICGAGSDGDGGGGNTFGRDLNRSWTPARRRVAIASTGL